MKPTPICDAVSKLAVSMLEHYAILEEVRVTAPSNIVNSARRELGIPKPINVNAGEEVQIVTLGGLVVLKLV